MDLKKIGQSIFKTTAIKAVELIVFGIVAGYYGNKVVKDLLKDVEQNIIKKVEVENNILRDSLMKITYINQGELITTQQTILLKLKRGNEKDSIMAKSIIDLGAKVLMKEDFQNFITPYLSEKKKLNQGMYLTIQ